MTTYQLVPYLISVSVRGKPKETRPLDDLLGGGEQLADALGGLLVVHKGKLCRQDSDAVRPLTLRVESVSVGVRQLNATMAPGKSGVVSKIRSPKGAEIDRNFNDTELMPLRHFLIYAAGGHRAILLAERVGGAGAITPLAALMKDCWRARYPDTVLNIDAAMTEEAWQSSLAKRPVKGWRFTKSATANGNMKIGKHEVEYRVDVVPASRMARWKLKKQLKEAATNSTPLAQVILREATPILAPSAQDREKAAKSLFDDGWQVAVNLDLEGGVSRTVYVEQSVALSMSFPVIEGENEPATQPGDPLILEAVKRIVADGLLSSWGIGKHHADSCTWSKTSPMSKAGWEVKWDVID